MTALLDRRKRIYCGMIWKKGILILPRFLLTLAGTLAALALATFLVYTVMQHRQSLLPRIRAAVVVLDGDVATAMTVRMVAEMEAIKNVADVEIMNRRDAEAAVRNGSVQASIYLTEDIYHDFASQTNTPVLVQVSRDSGLGVQRFYDLVQVGLSLLQTGQNTLVALDEVEGRHPMLIDKGELEDSIADDFVTLAINRNNIWKTTVLSAYDPVSIAGYYSMAGALAIVCLFFGTGFAALYDKKERAVDVCLKRMGISALMQSFSRLLVMTFVSWVMFLLVLIPAFYVADTKGEGAEAVLRLIPGLLPAAFCVAAFIHLIHSFAVGESGSLFYLITSLLLFVLGGGIFPAAFLPPVLYHIAGFLPIRLWLDYLSGLLWNGFSWRSLAVLLAAGFGMAAAGVLGLKLRERRSIG